MGALQALLPHFGGFLPAPIFWPWSCSELEVLELQQEEQFCLSTVQCCLSGACAGCGTRPDMAEHGQQGLGLFQT